MKYSLFMIKPWAYQHKEEILSIIAEDLNIVCTKDVVLTEEFLKKLYEEEKDKEIQKINISQLTGQLVCIGIVSGDNAIEDLIKICGKNPKGTLCPENSIRYRFNPSEDEILVGNRVYFLNAIHKADSKDAINSVAVFINEYLKEEIKNNSKLEVLNELLDKYNNAKRRKV